MLLHAPYGGPQARKDAWRGLVECVEAGTVRSIGVSNYGVHHLDELEAYMRELEAERPGSGGVLSVGQWEVHPWCAREDVAAWCRARGVVVEAYSPLVRGERWGEPVLKRLAEKYGVSEAQVLLRWSLQKGYVPLPSTFLPLSPCRESDDADTDDARRERDAGAHQRERQCLWVRADARGGRGAADDRVQACVLGPRHHSAR